MSENMGEISYNVSVNTADTLKAESAVESSVNKIASDFGKIDQASKRTATQITATASAVKKGMGGAGQAAQNFSYQIQDIAVQLAGGQNPFLIIAQQLPQMLVGMGAAAAGIGALVAVAGGLAMAMYDTSTETEKLEKLTETLGKTFTKTAGGSAALKNEILELARISEAAVRQKLNQSLLDANATIKSTKSLITEGINGAKWYEDTNEGVNELISAFRGLNEEGGRVYTQFNTGYQSQKRLDNAAIDLGKSLGFSGDQALKMGREVANLIGYSQSANADFGKFVDQLSRLSNENPSEKLTAMATSLIELARKGADAQAIVKLVNDELAKTGEAFKTEKIASMVESLTQKLSVAKKELTDGKVAAIALAAAFELGLTSAEQLPPEIAKLISEINKIETTKGIEKLTESIENQRAQLTMTADGYEQYALRKKLAAEGASQAVIEANLKELKSQQELRADLALMDQVDSEDRQLKITTTTKSKAIADKTDPLGALQRQKEEELAIIAAAEQQGVDLHRSYADVRASIDEEYNAKIASAMEAQFIAQSEGNAFLMESLDALNQSATTTISGLLSGTMSATEAMQNFANIILNQAVGALVDVGIQYVKNALIKSAMDKSMMASEMATKATAAAMHTAAVGATVAELSSLAAAGAFAATAAIPIVGPALAPAAALGAASSAAALGAPAIAAAPIAGGRQFGGGVSANSMYRVGEAGPEIFQSNTGQNFMIPGQNGKVLSNGDSMGAMGGGNVSVVINNAPAGTTANVSQQSNGRERTIIVDLAVKEVARQISENQGLVPKALKSSTNTTMKASR